MSVRVGRNESNEMEEGESAEIVRMAERSKALRSGRSPLMWAWVRIPLLTVTLSYSFPTTQSHVTPTLHCTQFTPCTHVCTCMHIYSNNVNQFIIESYDNILLFVLKCMI